MWQAVIKVSAIEPDCQIVTAPAAVFTTEAAVKAAYESGKLNRDVIIILRPRAQWQAACPIAQPHPSG